MAENENRGKWFRFMQKIAIFKKSEGAKFVAKPKSGGRMDFIYNPFGKKPFARLDRPHKGTPFPHLNIDPKYTKRPDPHMKVPESAYKAVPVAVKTAEIIGQLAFYAAVAYDTCKLGNAIANDYRNNTSSETVDTATDISGTWVGGCTGAALGAKAGTLASPGFGTFIGGFAGAIFGAYYGRVGAEYAIDKILKKEEQVEVKIKKFYFF